MFDSFCRGILLLSQPYVMLAIIVLGYFFHDRLTYKHAFILVLLSMLLNVHLKAVFQVPALTGLHGWSFPSGHTQVSAVFWGWLAWRAHKPLVYGLCSLIIAGIGFSLVHFNYHHSIDITAALIFAALTLGGYQLCLNYWSGFTRLCNRMLQTFVLLSGISLWLYFIPGPLPQHASIAYLLLVAIILCYDQNLWKMTSTTRNAL